MTTESADGSRFASLRDYLAAIDKKGLLKRVEGADWDLEIGALTEIVAFSKAPRALLFDSIKGHSKGFRVLTNPYVSQELQAIALGLPDSVTGVKLVQMWRDKSKRLKSMEPKVVDTGEVFQNKMEGDSIDVLKFPSPKWHEFDGGRYIGTGDVVITKDPKEGWVNLGVYRCMVHDKTTIGMQIIHSHHGAIMMERYWAMGQDAPVAIALGQDPYLYGAACAPMPWGKSELDYASALKGEQVEVIMDEETGLPIPASAEIVVMGHIPPMSKVAKDEGPFGECTGYYTLHGPERVVQIDRIFYRNDPIIQGNPPMHGSARMHSLGAELVTSAAAWDSIEKGVPNVRGVFSMYQPCQVGSTILVVAIKQAYPGHAMQAGLAALSGHTTTITNKAVIVVDEDVDPSSLDDVLFATTSRCNPDTDIRIISGIPGHPLDPALPMSKREVADFTSSTMIVDATRKPYGLRDRFPRVNAVSPELKEKTLKKWEGVLSETRSDLE